MNSNYSDFIIAGLAGLVLGIAYFGSLWLAVRRAMRTRSALFVIGSGVVRLAILLSGVWLATRAEWQLVVVCMCAILIGRQVVFAATNNLWSRANESQS